MITHLLREYIREALIGASQHYLGKETIRKSLQEFITAAINDGKITDDESLKQFIADSEMALAALRMVPFAVFKRLIDSKETK